MSLSEISIKKPVFAWMLMSALIIFGGISFLRMGVSQLPDVDFPVVTVNLKYEGAAPEVMESDVVDIVEDSVMTVEAIRTVSSYSRYGNATVKIEFDLGRDIDAALQEVQTKIAQAQKRLPKEMDPPVVTKTNPEDQPILWLTVSSDRMEPKDLARYVRDRLKDKFSTVAGVGEVMLAGYTEPNLRVWVDPRKLGNYELSVGDVLSTLTNEHSELPAGQIQTDRREYDVRTMGEAKTAEEFSQIVINDRGGRPNYRAVRLKEIARVEEGLAEVRTMARFNGKPAIGLGIKKQRGTNAVDVAKSVLARVEQVNPSLPEGMTIARNFNSTKFIEQSVGALNHVLIIAAILTGIVCWLFLGSWSSTMNVLMAIPTSIIGAFIMLAYAGFTLNTFTLLGLSLAIGIVVDDAIMVLENIVRHNEMGKGRYQAALDGSKEITFAAIAATIAIVAIFLPVAFMRGVIGRFFFEFGVTMTVTVLLSLVEALTLTPMRCSQFMESGHRTTKIGLAMEKMFQTFATLYEQGLRWVLVRRAKVIGGAFAFFAVSMLSVIFLNKEFVPSQDQGVFLIRLQAPVDSSLNYTNEKLKAVEAFIAGRPEVDRSFAAIGGPGGTDVTTAMVFVSLKERSDRDLSQQKIMALYRKELSKIPEVRVIIQDMSMRGFTASRGFPVEFSIRGPSWDQLEKSSTEIMKRLEATGLVNDVDSDYRLGKPEIRVIPDRIKAALHGVSIRAISETVSALVGGLIQGKYAMDGHRYDIRVRAEPDDRDRTEQIKNLTVRNNRGELVRLSDVVTLEERKSLQQIARYDRERAVSIFANIKPGQSQAAALAAAQKIGKEVLPDGYNLVMSGSSQTFKESFQDLVFALILGVIVAYMVLASQFNSFIDPVTVLIALPFSLSGAFVALLFTGQSLNIYSFIGLILLMGIVKKNSILIVEFANHYRDQYPDLSTKDVLLKACPVRLRPILMTSFATIAAAIPEALPIGAGFETRIPMAVSVIGGVFVSTFLTLFVVPCAYSWFSEMRAKRMAGKVDAFPEVVASA